MRQIYRNLRVTAVLLAFALAISPVFAQSTDGWPTPPEGTVQMTSGEIEAAVVGNSWMYNNGLGGVYFNPNGDAATEWKGKKEPGKWYIEYDEVCLDVTSWGGDWCYKFYRSGGDVWTYYSTESNYFKIPFKPGNEF